MIKGMTQEVYIDIRNKFILNSNGILDKRNIHFMENGK